MPGDLRIRYCSRIPDDSWAESPCNREGKSMTARPLTPGKQRWAHTERAGTDSGGRPAQGSQLEGATITWSFTAKACNFNNAHSVNYKSQNKQNKNDYHCTRQGRSLT